ncbi:MAG TPA: methyl-accepting chemotaxis protein [Kineosporiaceae bacterium]|nr:methyl-accepting chemotaxis protein [Kineosporiaceae bacterium]
MARLRGSLGGKFLMALLLVDVVLVTVGVLNLTSQSDLYARVSATNSRDLVPLSHLRGAQNMDHTIVISNFAAGSSSDPAIRDGLLKLIPGYRTQLEAEFTGLRQSAPADMQGRVASLIDSYQQMTAADNAYRASPSGEGAKARADKATALYLGTEQKFGDLATAIMADAQKQKQAVADSYRSSQQRTIALLVLGVLIGLALAVRLTRSVRRRTAIVIAALTRMAHGDLSATVEVSGQDEIAQMGSALNTGLAAVRTAFTEVTGSVSTLAQAARDLTDTSEASAGAVQAAAGAVQGIADNAGTVAITVDRAAASTTELGASIREISDNAQQAARVAGQAVGVVESTNATISQLGNSSQEIGNVIQVIQSIAAQTSLLALNATIEAARAGDAGRGFAVVAGEVKDLARETAEATESVISRVQAIQADTEGAVHAIAEIGEIIQQINSFQGTIAAAVEEQSVTTDAISANIGEAVQVTREIAEAIANVGTAARDDASAVDSTRALAAQVAEMGGQLGKVVGQFQI